MGGSTMSDKGSFQGMPDYDETHYEEGAHPPPFGQQQVPPGRARHAHALDAGMGSLIAYFFCMLSSVSIRLSGKVDGSVDGSVIVSLLVFSGAVSLMLLFLAMSESYLMKHDPYRLMALAAGALMAAGPLVYGIEALIGAMDSFLVYCAFSLSGCGYAIGLLIWGRILSIKDEDASSRQVLADTCFAVIVMVASSVLPELLSMLAMVFLAFVAAITGYRAVPSTSFEVRHAQEHAISDTRKTIPLFSYFAGSAPWIVCGVFIALLSGVHVFDGHIGSAEAVAAVIAIASGAIIIRLHRSHEGSLVRVSWASIPLLVSALIIYVTGDERFLKLDVALIVSSMVLSYLHLMAHFSALAHREDLFSNQIFSWGWLGPSIGLSVGIFVGIVCLVSDLSSVNVFLSLMGSLLVLALIASMRSIESVVSRHRERSFQDESRNMDAAASEDVMGTVFTDMGLSERERDVAFLLLEGRSQPVIADQLSVATSTVNTHVKHIYQKAGVRSKQEFIEVCHSKKRRALSSLSRSAR